MYLLGFTIKDGTEAGADADKDRGMPGLARMESLCPECSCAECEYGASVVRAEEWQEEGEMKLNLLYSTCQGKLTAD